MENLADDPREFSGAAGDFDDPFAGGGDNLLFGLQNLLQAMGSPPPGASRSRSTPGTAAPGSPVMGGGSRFAIRIDRTSAQGGGARTTFSTRPIQSDRSGEIPTLSDYVNQNGSSGPRQDRDTINGPLMFQYLLAMLQQPGRRAPMGDMFEGMMPPGAESGRMGDYVFNQEALDQIITQIMENSSAHPVPAPEDVMEKLPREVLEEKSPLLEKDCAVCKEQFQLNTEDPDEQVVVTLPCKHPFHEPCIMPWLKSSGTCPVCRYQLVPQPEHHPPGPGTPGGSNSPNGPRSPPRSPGANNTFGGSSGLFGSLVNMLSSGGTSSTGGNNSSTGQNRTGSSQRSQTTSPNHDEHGIPGSWNGNEVD